MKPEVLHICKEATLLAKEVQPMIEKQAACEDMAVKVSDILVSCGLVSIEKRAEVAGELKDPLVAYDYIVKLAEKLPAVSLGEPGEKSAPYGDSADERFLNWIAS